MAYEAGVTGRGQPPRTVLGSEVGALRSQDHYATEHREALGHSAAAARARGNGPP